MRLLDGTRVLAWQDASESPLARFLRDLGAAVERLDTPLRAQDLATADILLEHLGLTRIEETGLSRARIEAANVISLFCTGTFRWRNIAVSSG